MWCQTIDNPSYILFLTALKPRFGCQIEQVQSQCYTFSVIAIGAMFVIGSFPAGDLLILF